jgi:deazaflavin-dependent oxidoreductase (nitroreductase family)
MDRGRHGGVTTPSDFAKAVGDTDEIELTTTGQHSGRARSRTVWFVQKRQTLYLLPVTGSDSAWYWDVLKTPRVRLRAGQAQHEAEAKPIGDPAAVEQVVGDFRAKYGAPNIEAYYPKHDVAVEVPLA